MSSDGSQAPGPVVCVVGARPNYMKMAPIVRSLRAHDLRILLVHTGQHYDSAMNERLFADLNMPLPDLNLEVGSGTHAVQTAEIMRRFEPVLDAHRPSCVLVVGDVNSTLACSLVASKKGVPVVHVEAGLRSNDRSMPEEINRLLTDQLADVLYTTERSAHANLAREGIDGARIEFVGNVMIDSLLASLEQAVAPVETLRRAGRDGAILSDRKGYGLVTLHRPSNVDHEEALGRMLSVLREVSVSLPLVFPIHPRCQANIESFGLGDLLASERIVTLPPLGYLEMLGLMAGATLVLTDSGGIQEETTALSVPCITLRENTERPITVEQGTNVLAGCERGQILQAVDATLADGGKRGCLPEYWDGAAAERIASHLGVWLTGRQAADRAGREGDR